MTDPDTPEAKQAALRESAAAYAAFIQRPEVTEDVRAWRAAVEASRMERGRRWGETGASEPTDSDVDQIERWYTSMPYEEQIVTAAIQAADRVEQGTLDLDGLARLAVADERHRYEINADGNLSVTPVGDPATALVVSRLVGWLASYGFGPERLAVHLGIVLSDGGVRVPTLTVWADGAPPRPAGSAGYAAVDKLMLVIDVMTADAGADRLAEYAAAGIPQAWIVEPDGSAVHRHVFEAGTGRYTAVPGVPQRLDLLLGGKPEIV